MRRLLLALAILSLGGCASGYSSFYQAYPGATPEAISQQRAGPPPAIPNVERIAPGDPAAIGAAMNQRGYQSIGYSSFNSGRSESEAAAVEQGRKVGADLVLIINPQYTGTVTTTVPITTPTTSTSYTTGTATAYGPAGTVNAYGSATTTTYGSKTNYIPIATNRYDYTSVYFIKGKFRLGMYTRPLSNEERQELQTNQGAVVTVIVDGTPAFNADLLPGDVITSIGGIPVSSPESFTAASAANAGKLAEIRYKRRGVDMTKQVQLNP